jgi:hypothetical protein
VYSRSDHHAAGGYGVSAAGAILLRTRHLLCMEMRGDELAPDRLTAASAIDAIALTSRRAGEQRN